MSFLSLTNFLHGNSIQRHFHADPRVRAVEPLLYERIPILSPLHPISTRERVALPESVGEAAPSVSQFDTPHTSTPKTQLLCNGRYGLMITNAGGDTVGGATLKSHAGGRIGLGIRGEPSAISMRPNPIAYGPTRIIPSVGRLRRTPPTSRSTVPCSGAPITAFKPKRKSSSHQKMTLRFGGSP